MMLGSRTKLISLPAHRAGVMMLQCAYESSKNVNRIHFMTKGELPNNRKELFPH